MTTTTEIDYIIVGGGIAGSTLAYTLLKKNAKIIIIDNSLKDAASIVAAGLYNPIVFKRLVPSWLAEELISYLDLFYGELETLLKARFHYKRNIIKLFSEQQELDLWQTKQQQESTKLFLETPVQSNYKTFINSTIGAGSVVQAGNVDTPVLLKKLNEYFSKNDLLVQEKFDFDLLQLNENRASYKNINAKGIIFAEGYNIINNPYFKWVNMKLTKGEVLTINAVLDSGNDVINKGVFTLPQQQGTYKVGATYEWQDLSIQTTEKGLSELQHKLNAVITAPYTMIKHEVGIRPTVNDRRPVLGTHPQYKTLHVFNGMGTKGVMLAPYFAKQMANYLIEKTPLMKEVNVNRFSPRT